MHRSNIDDFSDDEKLYYEQKEMEKKRREHERIEKQKYLDNLHFKNYEKVNNIMSDKIYFLFFFIISLVIII